MSRGALFLLLFAGALAACGGSQKQAGTSSAPTATASGSTTATSATSTVTSTGTAAHRRPSGHPRKVQIKPPSNVRLPARYVVGAGATLTPPTISAPSGVTIALTVVSGDGHAHRVRVLVPGGLRLTIPAGGRASSLLTGLKDGSYAVDVDGGRRGTLVVGVAPGP